MTEKKNAIDSTRNAVNGKGKQSTIHITTQPSGNDSTTENKIVNRIEGQLLHGEKNAIKHGKLMSLIGERDVRSFYSAVADERSMGAVILSSSKGYYLPDTDGDGNVTQAGYLELKKFCNRKRSAGISEFKAAKAARKAMREYEQREQLTIEDEVLSGNG